MEYTTGISKVNYVHFDNFEDFDKICDAIGLEMTQEDGYYFTSGVSVVDEEKLNTIKEGYIETCETFSSEPESDVLDFFEGLRPNLGEFDTLELSYGG